MKKIQYDAAHRQTDVRLIKTEKELNRIYAENTKGIYDDLNKYFEKYKDEDEVKKAQVESGELDKSEYVNWRASLLHSKEYNKIISNISKRLTEANSKALEHINDKMADVYIDNYNAAGKDIEKQCRKL